ncbi:hypothetical protein LTR70_002159 [Exophiala xenobiotica]|uniref:Uncharacterized protein n=1 Tax=Lithohypha guttulata TaxID=1690604 RepID=A0ABR0K4W5_9EURO|nr:hypothetical protein LTR24_006793 [Lithohypha guttulata]KAK5326159.1 hypothetical protein LTR70_002159 [Exophiala xenobiotica]
MYRLKDPRQIPTSKPTNPMTTAMAPLKIKDRMPVDAPKASGKPQSRPIPQDEERRNAVNDASTAEPLENRFESFPAFESYYQAERRMSLHPDNEAEIVAEMKSNKSRELARVDSDEEGSD